jgi:hypothetical protein
MCKISRMSVNNSVDVQKGPIAVFTFGRFQPPTSGHKLLIDAVSRIATENGGDGYIFVSSKLNSAGHRNVQAITRNMKRTGNFKSTGNNENPLTVDVKMIYLNKMYPSDERDIRFINTTKSDCRNVPSVFQKLFDAGYTKVIMVVGSDRVESFSKSFSRANDSVTVVSAGERNLENETSNDPTKMSGTKMRKAALRGDVDFFGKGVKIGSMTDADVIDLMNLVRAGLGFPPFAGKGGNRRNTRKRS